LNKLKEQGESYKKFNEQILRHFDPKQIGEVDNSEAKDFKRQLKKIDNAEYFDIKYNIDYQILKKFKEEAREARAEVI